MSTALTIIKDALQEIGVIDGSETPSDDDAAKALRAMNDLLESWNLQSLAVFAQNTTSFNLIAGQSSYTIGPAGNFNGLRPTQIYQAYVRYQTVDFPVEVIDNERYNEISLKSQTGIIPGVLNYEPTMPLGTITIWPVPLQAIPLTILYDKVVATTPVTLTTDLGFPPGYNRAFTKSLSLELCPVFARAASPELIQLARSSMQAIKRNNKRNHPASYDPAMVDYGYWQTSPWVPIP